LDFKSNLRTSKHHLYSNNQTSTFVLYGNKLTTHKDGLFILNFPFSDSLLHSVTNTITFLALRHSYFILFELPPRKQGAWRLQRPVSK